MKGGASTQSELIKGGAYLKELNPDSSSFINDVRVQLVSAKFKSELSLLCAQKL